MVVGTSDSRSANVAGIGSKAGKFYASSLTHVLKGSLPKAFADRFQKMLAGF